MQNVGRTNQDPPPARVECASRGMCHRSGRTGWDRRTCGQPGIASHSVSRPPASGTPRRAPDLSNGRGSAGFQRRPSAQGPPNVIGRIPPGSRRADVQTGGRLGSRAAYPNVPDFAGRFAPTAGTAAGVAHSPASLPVPSEHTAQKRIYPPSQRTSFGRHSRSSLGQGLGKADPAGSGSLTHQPWSCSRRPWRRIFQPLANRRWKNGGQSPTWLMTSARFT
jgi:hypothetical protein